MMRESRSQEERGLIEYLGGIIVPLFFRYCLLKIITLLSLSKQKAGIFFTPKRLNHLSINALKVNQQSLFS